MPESLASQGFTRRIGSLDDFSLNNMAGSETGQTKRRLGRTTARPVDVDSPLLGPESLLLGDHKRI